MARIELGLERIHSLLSHFPPYSRPTIHIAGTNGKGSVSALLTSVFLEPQRNHKDETTSSDSESEIFNVGRFNSPHLVSVLDSVTINNVPISSSIFEGTSSKINEANAAHGIQATPFELLAATALVIFESQKVDLVILEVGMGGRLDATNGIPSSSVVLSIITSIDLDHQAFLGNTVQAIAREKAGIIREGGVAVLSPQQHGEGVVKAVGEVAEAKKAKLVIAMPAKEGGWEEGTRAASFSLNPVAQPPPRPVQIDEFRGECPFKLQLPLHGNHQLSNLGTVLTAISTIQQLDLARFPTLAAHASRLSPEAVRLGVLNCTWPGRLSFHTYLPRGSTSKSVAVIADGAHNAGASELLSSYLHTLFSSLTISENTPPRSISLTYILALSHSPPKTPDSVLLPLLTLDRSRFPTLDIRIGVAALRFTPPQGMPWVASVPPSGISGIVSREAPDAELWSAPDNSVIEGSLKEALEWASQRGGEHTDKLILVAGSLYLVADFYRLVGSQ